MKIVKKLIGISVATVMGLSIATGALADTKTQDLEVTIHGGGLSLEVPDVNSISNITLTKERDSFNAGFDDVFTIRDLTGKQAGWELSVSASPLTSGSHQLPAGSLTIYPAESIKRIDHGSSNLDLPTINNSEKIIDDGKVIIANAEVGTGMGSFELTFENDNALGLHFDALTAKEGTYESTLTWSLVTAP